MVGKIINHVPELLEAKGKSHMDLMYDLRLAHATASDWAEVDGRTPPNRIDFPTLAKLCSYFNVGVGKILEYVPDK